MATEPTNEPCHKCGRIDCPTLTLPFLSIEAGTPRWSFAGGQIPDPPPAWWADHRDHPGGTTAARAWAYLDCGQHHVDWWVRQVESGGKLDAIAAICTAAGIPTGDVVERVRALSASAGPRWKEVADGQHLVCGKHVIGLCLQSGTSWYWRAGADESNSGSADTAEIARYCVEVGLFGRPLGDRP